MIGEPRSGEIMDVEHFFQSRMFENMLIFKNVVLSCTLMNILPAAFQYRLFKTWGCTEKHLWKKAQCGSIPTKSSQKEMNVDKNKTLLGFRL